MKAVRRWATAALRWAADWRTGLAVAATGIVALLMVMVVTGAQNTSAALDARNRTASAASRRIDKLNDRIEVLTTSVADGNRQVGQLRAEIAALQEQIRLMGGRPVVPASTTSTTSPRQRGSASTTSTTAPRPPPTTTSTTMRPCRVAVASVCVP